MRHICQTFFHIFSRLPQSDKPLANVGLLGLLSVCGVRNIDGAGNPILEGVPGLPWALTGKSVQVYY
jgi:hypothetical protein